MIATFQTGLISYSKRIYVHGKAVIAARNLLNNNVFYWSHQLILEQPYKNKLSHWMILWNFRKAFFICLAANCLVMPDSFGSSFLPEGTNHIDEARVYF